MKASYLKKLISSIIATVMLLYFMVNTSSPKMVFVLFLIAGVAMVGKSIAQLLKKDSLIVFFSRMFVLSFVLFFFGFFVAACYISARDKNYGMLIILLPIWLVGMNMIRKRIGRKEEKNAAGGFSFGIVVSAGLVIMTIAAGILMIVLGIQRLDYVLIFAGVFFAFGAFTFVLAALAVKGALDKFKIDVFGLYIGVLFIGMGIGFLALKYSETHSVTETFRAFGLWIIIPIVMAVAGMIQIVKCLRKNQEK